MECSNLVIMIIHAGYVKFGGLSKSAELFWVFLVIIVKNVYL